MTACSGNRTNEAQAVESRENGPGDDKNFHRSAVEFSVLIGQEVLMHVLL